MKSYRKNLGIGSNASFDQITNSIKERNARRRERNESMATAIGTAVNEQAYINDMQKETALDEGAVLINNSNDKITRSKARHADKVSKLKETVNIENSVNEAAQDVVDLYFANVLYESLPLANEDKESLMEDIMGPAVSVIQNRHTGNSTYLETIKGKAINNIVASENFPLNGDRLPKQVVYKIVAELRSQDESFNVATNYIKQKVSQAVGNEQRIAARRQELTEAEKYVDKDTKTLFRTLQEANIHADLAEGVEATDVADQALVESIIQYGIMEALNTLKVTPEVGNSDKIRSAVRYFDAESVLH